MRLYTIGFTQTSAEEFFETLKDNDVKHVIDVRLHPDSHLAGFARQLHLIYFLREICDATYEHDGRFAPAEEMFTGFRDGEIEWGEYRQSYLNLLDSRISEEQLNICEGYCLLCSEIAAERCHRRLAAEYLLNSELAVSEIKHL